MTVTDTFLNELAKHINDEASNMPNYLAVGTTEVTNIATTDTAIAGEIGTRVLLTKFRANNEIETSAIRSAAVVENTVDGDALNSAGLFNTITQSTTDLLLTGIAVNGVLQTTNFDVEYITTIEVLRR